MNSPLSAVVLFYGISSNRPAAFGQSQDSRKDLVGHGLAVFVPELSILRPAPNIITERPVREESAEEDKVEVGNKVVETGRGRPAKRQEQFRHVVEVPGETPPAGKQQERGLFLAVASHVGGLDHLRGLAPNQFFAVGAAEILALPIGVVIDVDRAQPDGEDAHGNRPRPLNGVVDKVELGTEICGRNPSEHAPA